MINWEPIETSPRKNGEDVLLWHGRANVGGWQDSWPYDQRYPSAETEGAWIINGGYVVRPTHWAPINPVKPDTCA